MSEVRSGAEMAPLDPEAERRALAEEMERTGEMDALTSQIDVNDMNSILSFGAQAAGRVAGASDAALRDLAAPGPDDSGELMEALAGIMGRVDPDALRGKRSLWGRLFNRPRDELDEMLDEYHAMGGELDRVYAGLRAWERQLERIDRQLESVFQANADYYRDLQRYILAGEQGCREIADYIAQRRGALEATGDRSVAFELQTLDQALAALRRRVGDLRTAETVALQTLSMVRTVQMNNAKLAEKIDSAFLVTLPVFRRMLAQAVEMKRQRLQSEAMSALRGRAGDVPGHAPGTRNETESTPDALERSRRSILAGLDETRNMASSARAQREREREQLERIKREYDGETRDQGAVR